LGDAPLAGVPDVLGKMTLQIPSRE
jgi:hypothetical protein